VPLGAHVPIGGGLHQAPARGDAIGADAIQIFTRNQMQWACRPLSDEDCAAFRRAVSQSGVREVLVHGSYLVNLAGADADFLARSRECFLTEMARCHRLGIRYLVFHPGAHLGAGESAGIDLLARNLDDLLARTEGLDVVPLIEVTAGQGTNLGHRFEHLAAILERTRRGDRLGICLDTCHLYAAGYDIASPEGYERMVRQLDRIVGLQRVGAIHLNDSKQGLGSRLDRHARAGEGTLGLATFERILNDRRLRHLPMVVETPGPAAEWKKEIARLRKLVRPSRAPRAARRTGPRA
jgi:deoxyribonuclease-4